MNEAKAIALVRKGNTDAFAEIVECYQAPIFRYLYRMTGEWELARDLAQDTFLKAYKNILKTDSNLSFKAWLYRIATNNALQHYRRKRLISFIPLVDSVQNECVDEVSHKRIEDKLAIEEALLKIPKDQKVCFVLHFVEGFKYREIADILGIKEDAVRKRVARGSNEFKRIYRQTGVRE
ncbi:RNA polymerase sigma factor [Chloroflexota bacterium]